MFEKSAKQVMKEIIFNSLVENLNSLKKNNVDNAVLREVKAIHDNTTFSDIPPYLQDTINKAVDKAFVKFNSSGFNITTKN